MLAAAAELHYRPNLLARSLTQKTTRIIGVAIDELKNPHSMKMIDVATRELQARGYMALLLNITEGENYQAVIAMADQLQVDGILFLGTVISDELFDIARTLYEIPLVQVCRNNDKVRGIDVVNLDGYQAGREMAKLLVEQGYSRFGYMKGPDTESAQLLRMEGFRDELQVSGQQINSLLIAGNYNRRLSFVTMNNYLNATAPLERIEALFCEDDILALGALEG